MFTTSRNIEQLHYRLCSAQTRLCSSLVKAFSEEDIDGKDSYSAKMFIKFLTELEVVIILFGLPNIGQPNLKEHKPAKGFYFSAIVTFNGLKKYTTNGEYDLINDL